MRCWACCWQLWHARVVAIRSSRSRSWRVRLPMCWELRASLRLRWGWQGTGACARGARPRLCRLPTPWATGVPAAPLSSPTALRMGRGFWRALGSASGSSGGAYAVGRGACVGYNPFMPVQERLLWELLTEAPIMAYWFPFFWRQAIEFTVFGTCVASLSKPPQPIGAN